MKQNKVLQTSHSGKRCTSALMCQRLVMPCFTGDRNLLAKLAERLLKSMRAGVREEGKMEMEKVEMSLPPPKKHKKYHTDWLLKSQEILGWHWWLRIENLSLGKWTVMSDGTRGLCLRNQVTSVCKSSSIFTLSFNYPGRSYSSKAPPLTYFVPKLLKTLQLIWGECTDPK